MQLPHRSFRKFGSRCYFDYHFVVDQHVELVSTEPMDFVIEKVVVNLVKGSDHRSAYIRVKKFVMVHDQP